MEEDKTVFVRQKPGNGIVVEEIKAKNGKSIPVYGAEPLKTGKTYQDSGYPGSIRRKREMQ